MNITYDIIESKENNISDIDNHNSDHHSNDDHSNDIGNIMYNQDEILALITNYNINYSVSYLNNIMEFYNIKKKKKNMKKQDIIDIIVDFETNLSNKNIVSKRIKLFSNFIELKNNDFFNKFIIGSL